MFSNRLNFSTSAKSEPHAKVNDVITTCRLVKISDNAEARDHPAATVWRRRREISIIGDGRQRYTQCTCGAKNRTGVEAIRDVIRSSRICRSGKDVIQVGDVG